jgi:hypothetical protein
MAATQSVLSDDDFLKRTGAAVGGAVTRPEEDDAFLSRTGAKPAIPTVAKSEDQTEPTLTDEYGRPIMPTTLPKAPSKQAVLDFLGPAPNTTYGDILPLARDNATNTLHFALPNIIRSPLLGVAQGPEAGATIDPSTGTLGITPEAQAVAGFAASPLRFGPLGPVPNVLAAREAPLSPEFRAAPIAAPAAIKIEALNAGAPVSAVPAANFGAAGADVTREPIPELTPAQKATALQKMVGQPAEDRLSPQGRDDAVYFPGVERPEAMKDFSDAPEGQMSTALEHKALYNTDSHYHDQFDAQVKKNNAVMTDGTTLPDGTRVAGLKDMFGDANARDAAMEDARALMPGSVKLFDGEKETSIQPIVDKVNEILSSGKGKIDAVANNLRPILKKLYDADGNPETLPSQIKGIYDDINNKLYDRTPTKEGNEARQASDQLKAVKAVVSDVIGAGLPGTKWADYLTNLSGALGQVNKFDYMQQFLTGSKSLWGSDGMLQFNKVNKMLEDIRQRSADPTGGARQMTMDEINKIEAVRNELAAKDLLDKRAGVRGSPTVQLANAAGGLGSGPLGAGIKGAAEAALHAGLAATTGGVGNAALAGYRYIVKPAVQAARDQRAANTLEATKQRLLDTTPNPLSLP